MKHIVRSPIMGVHKADLRNARMGGVYPNGKNARIQRFPKRHAKMWECSIVMLTLRQCVYLAYRSASAKEQDVP